MEGLGRNAGRRDSPGRQRCLPEVWRLARLQALCTAGASPVWGLRLGASLLSLGRGRSGGLRDFPGGSVVKNLPANAGGGVQSLDREDPLEVGMATHSCILAWRIHGQRSLVGHKESREDASGPLCQDAVGLGGGQ